MQVVTVCILKCKSHLANQDSVKSLSFLNCSAHDFIQLQGVCTNCQQAQAVVDPMEKESQANEHSDPD